MKNKTTTKGTAKMEKKTRQTITLKYGIDETGTLEGVRLCPPWTLKKLMEAFENENARIEIKIEGIIARKQDDGEWEDVLAEQGNNDVSESDTWITKWR